MLSKILVATDLTDASLPALQAAFGLAQRLGSDVVALFVAEPTFGGQRWSVTFEKSEIELMEALRVRRREQALEALRRQVEEVRRTSGHSGEFRCLVQEGIAVDTILDAAAAQKADAIVMGTHGRTGTKHLLLGSVAEQVVRRSRVPVLTVRPAEGSAIVTP